MRPNHCPTILILLLLLVSGSLEAQDDGGYGYVRTLEGSATVTGADGDEPTPLTANHPLQVGDLLQTDSYSNLELVLPDFNVLRAGPVADVELRRLAFSADGDDRTTLLWLGRGEMQLVVTEHALGDELPRVDTPNASVYIHEPGVYVIAHDGWETTRLVVREGYAEAHTERGSAVARAGEEIVVDGLDRSDVTVVAAGSASELETWGEELTERAASTASGNVDPALDYAAAPLEESGEWIHVEGDPAWRPRVEVGWRPYTRGTWVGTPSGLTWVGYEPWSWVTGHYGYWSLHPYWGWIWYPGYVYSPAWVYWYWGPDWVGWVPRGYYGHVSWHTPVYGWAGGSWSWFSSWTFCPTRYIGYSSGYHHYRPGHKMAHYTGLPAVPRGAIASETAGITRSQWRDGAAVARTLAARSGAGSRAPDLTGFVAGRPGAAATRPPVVARAGTTPRDESRAAPRELQDWRRSSDHRRTVVSGSARPSPPVPARRSATESRSRDAGDAPAGDTRIERAVPRDERRGWRSDSTPDGDGSLRGWRDRYGLTDGSGRAERERPALSWDRSVAERDASTRSSPARRVLERVVSRWRGREEARRPEPPSPAIRTERPSGLHSRDGAEARPDPRPDPRSSVRPPDARTSVRTPAHEGRSGSSRPQASRPAPRRSDAATASSSGRSSSRSERSSSTRASRSSSGRSKSTASRSGGSHSGGSKSSRSDSGRSRSRSSRGGGGGS